MSRATLSLACLWWLTLVGAATAQSSLNSNDPGAASLQNFSGGVAFNGTYFQVQNVAGNGVGWRNGFTQLGLLSPHWVNEDFVIAANGRLLITDTQQIGGNFGGMARFYNEDWDRILGANGYFDIDQSINDNHYRQGTVGIESLGQWWDFRGNAYVPTSSGDHLVRAVGLGNDPFFFGNRVGFLGVGLFENSLYGGDFEVGVPVTPETPWLRAYSGMYFYRGNGHGEDPIGYRGRVEGWVSDDLSIGLNVTHDSKFGTNVNAVVNFLFSGWKPTRWFPNFTTRERMLTPVQRNWRIATGEYNDKVNVPAINPDTGEAYFVTWVDNSRLLPGIGTFERPFNFLPPADPRADMILVRTGNTSFLNPLTGSITLSDNQRLLGEGSEHQFRARAEFANLSNPTQTYNLPDPAFTNTGNFPFLSSLTNTVTIANNNEVSAFNLVGALGAGITNGVGGSQNFNLNKLNLIGNTGGGIVLSDTSGISRIVDVTALDNAAGGISVDSGANPLFLTMTNVISDGAQLFGVNINADGVSVVADLTNVSTTGNGTGIILTEFGSPFQAVLTDVNATNNLGDGLVVSGLAGSINLRLNTVDTSDNGGRGIFVTGNDTRINFTTNGLIDSGNVGDNINFTLLNGSILTGGLAGTQFDNSTGGSGIAFYTDAATIGSPLDPFIMQSVTADGNALFGLQLTAVNASNQYLAVLNGSLSNNGIDGINQVQWGGSHIELLVDPTTIDGNQRDGYHFELADGSSTTTVFQDDTLNDNLRSAVYGEVDIAGSGNSIVSLEMNNTTGLRSGADGLRIRSGNGANINAIVTDGDFSDSGQNTAGSAAVGVTANGSIINLSLLNTPGANTTPFPGGTQAYGMLLNLDDTLFTGTVTDGNFSDNLFDGIRANVVNQSTAFLNLTNVAVDNNGVEGMWARTTGGGNLTANVFDSSFSNNGQALSGNGQGLDLGVDGVVTPSSLTVNLDNTVINGNELEGIFGRAIGTAANSGLLAIRTSGGTSINQNNASGVTLNGAGGVIWTSFEASDISGNLGRGVDYDAIGLGAAPSSIAFISSTVNNNINDGFRFNVRGGNRLNLVAGASDFSNNGGAGINGLVDGAGSVANINPFLDVTADNNDLEGFRLLVDNGAGLNGNINGGSFSGNGQAGALDGVNIRVDHNAVAAISFDGTAVDRNTDDGFDLAALNGGTLNVALQTSGNFGTLSASNNDDQAVVFNTSAAGSGNLFMSGANVFNGNGSAVAAISYSATNSAQAVFSFSGTANDNAGDAINVQMTNVAQAYLDISGPGSLSDNGGSGADVTLNNVTFGVAPLNVNFLQGVFSADPFNISGLTMASNGDEAIRIDGTNVTLPNGTISSNVITNSGTNGSGDGILMTLTNSNVGTMTFNQNTLGSNSGDGLEFAATNSSVTNLNVTNNVIVRNINHGVNLNLDGTPIGTFNASNNLIGELGAGAVDPVGEFGPVIRAGFDSFTLVRQDDAPSATAAIGFDLNFFGTTYSDLFVNNNGNVTFDAVLSTFTPFPILTTTRQMIAPFFADVDTRNAGEPVTYGIGTVDGHNAFAVNWLDVDYFASSDTHTLRNTFQLVLVEREDVGPGDFDIEFNYGQITWETGDASGGTNGLGGSSARVGFTNGGSTAFELAGSAVNGAFLDSGPAGTRLVGNSLNSIITGRYHFFARGGIVSTTGAGPNGGDGIHIDQVNGSDIGTTQIAGNTITNNLGNGVNFNTVSNSALNTINILNNTISSNTGDGVRLVDPNLPALNKSINITANDNTIDLNGGNGVNLQISNGEVVTLAMAGNTIGTEGNGNTGMGVRAAISGFSTFNATVGDAAADANVFTANRDAGFGLTMSDDALGSLTVINSQFNGSVDGADTNFAGVGLGVILSDNVRLNPLHIGDFTEQTTSFNGNADDGFQLRMSDNTQLLGVTTLFNVQANGNGGDGASIDMIDQARIFDLREIGTAAGAEFSGNTGNGFALATNSSAILSTAFFQGITANENDGDGLQFNRQGNSMIVNVVMDDASANNNGGDGIDITAAASDTTDTYSFSDSQFTGNTGRGMLLNVIADSDLDVSLVNATITGNTLSGIEATVNSDVTDSPSVTLNVQGSNISLNGIATDAESADGIRIYTVNLTGDPTAFYDVTVNNSTISGNEADGISLLASGISEITNSTISANGDDGINIRADSGAVAISTITNNTIQANGSDGLELIVAGSFAQGDFTVGGAAAGDGNRILDNTGRGINLITAGGSNFTSTTTVANISNNTIARSGLEGVYIVNTSSFTQGLQANANNLASAALFTDGNLQNRPRTILTMDDNIIDSNGTTQTLGNFIGASGLVIRVGTSDANNDFTNNGGFFADGRGGVSATVRDNAFIGQFGGDVTFQPFIATADPAQTTGDWTDQNTAVRDNTDDVFTVTSFIQDPLARMDLVFTGNTGDGLIATRGDNGSVFYDNDESVFKSRTQAQDTATDAGPPDDNGPFDTGTRARNAVRLAGRNAPFNAPTLTINGISGNSDNFLYSGVGNSTFRVNQSGNVFTTSAFGFGTAILLDNGEFGERPFVWGVLP